MSALFLVPVAGFLGSFHCIAMCGPFVSYYGMGRTGPAWRSHTAYHLGRLTAYLGLGTLAGLIGRSFLYVGGMLDLQKVLMVTMGVAMIGAGLYELIPHKQGAVGKRLSGKIGGLLGRFGLKAGGEEGAALIGLFSTLLPCGFLYSYALAAGASGHPVTGMLIMLGFWLGTMPALLSVGFFTRYCSTRFISKLRLMTPIFLILFGILAINGKWMALPQTPGLGPLCHGF